MRKPNAVQKRWITSFGLNPNEWYVITWTAMTATLKHMQTGEIKKVDIYE